MISAITRTFFYTYQKKLSMDGFTSLELSFFASLASLPLLIPLAFYTVYTNGFSFSLSVISWIFVIGLLNIAALWVYMEALAQTDLGIAGSLKRLTPATVAVFEPLFLGTIFSPLVGIGCLLAGFGGYVLLLDGTDVFAPLRKLGDRGIQLGLLTAVAYGVASVGSRFGASNVSPYIFGAIISVIMTAGFWFALKFSSGTSSFPSRKSFAVLGISNAFKNISIWVAYSLASATHVTTANQITVIFNILAGGYFLGEEDMWKKLAGASLILAGIALVILY